MKYLDKSKSIGAYFWPKGGQHWMQAWSKSERFPCYHLLCLFDYVNSQVTLALGLSVTSNWVSSYPALNCLKYCYSSGKYAQTTTQRVLWIFIYFINTKIYIKKNEIYIWIFKYSCPNIEYLNIRNLTFWIYSISYSVQKSIFALLWSFTLKMFFQLILSLQLL